MENMGRESVVYNVAITKYAVRQYTVHLRQYLAITPSVLPLKTAQVVLEACEWYQTEFDQRRILLGLDGADVEAETT